MMNRVFARVYQDYFMPSRLGEYRAFLLAARERGYVFARHRDFAQAGAQPGQKLFFLRHDIDSDIKIAHQMLDIEQELGVTSTYYFRLCTLDAALMGRVSESGGEVGYHYEEIAQYAKAHRLHTAEAVLEALPTIQRDFIKNFNRVQAAAGHKIVSVASHGDFVNRRLGVDNHRLLSPMLRRELGIELEAYDAALGDKVTFRTTDREYPHLWNPASPMQGIEAESPVILALVHPSQWRRAPLERTRLNFLRLREGRRYGR